MLPQTARSGEAPKYVSAFQNNRHRHVGLVSQAIRQILETVLLDTIDEKMSESHILDTYDAGVERK